MQSAESRVDIRFSLEYNVNMIPEKVLNAVTQKRARMFMEKEKRIEIRKEKAFREISRLIGRFQEIDPSLKRIVLFGSLAENTLRCENFDIDLSFEGLEYYLCATETLNSPFKIDLVDYNVCASHIKDEIDTKGIVVYGPRP